LEIHKARGVKILYVVVKNYLKKGGTELCEIERTKFW